MSLFQCETCRRCGESRSTPVPPGWVTVRWNSRDRYDFCSPVCAANWLTSRDAPTPPQRKRYEAYDWDGGGE